VAFKQVWVPASNCGGRWDLTFLGGVARIKAVVENVLGTR
jgi:hypothetical protein